MFNLSKNCVINKFLPKTLFYKKLGLSTTLKDEFVNLIEKIIWKYKLSEDTLGITKTEKVEEIQIFELHLKEKKLPQNIIKAITKAIPYKILFIIYYKEEFCYSIKAEEIYFSEWNEKINIDFYGLNLETVYENIVKSIIKEENTSKDFEIVIENKNKEIKLSKELEQLRNKMKLEKQFNKKVELNQKLKEKERELEVIINE